MPVKYDVGQGIQYAYRVETYVRNLEQPASAFSMNYPAPAKTIMNIIATSLKDLVDKLLEVPYLWPIKTIEKYTKPVQTIDQRYLQGLGLYDPNDVRWVPVNLKDLPKKAEPLLIQYVGLEKAKITMGYFGPNSIIQGKGSIQVSGTSKIKFISDSKNYIGGGNVYIKGSSGVNSIGCLFDTHKLGSGVVYIHGEAAIKTSYLGEFVESANINLGLDSYDQIILNGTSNEDAPILLRQNKTSNIQKCGCVDIPTYFAIKHDFNRSSNLYNFLNRNALTLPTNIPIYYDALRKGYATTLQFRSKYEPENWIISVDLNCNNDLDNFDIDAIWTLTFIFKRSSPVGSGETVVRLWIPAESLCPTTFNRTINFALAVNVKQKIGLANKISVLPNVYINDQLGFFGSNAWIQNPILNLISNSIS
jgi:hypothetical protein